VSFDSTATAYLSTIFTLFVFRVPVISGMLPAKPTFNHPVHFAIPLFLKFNIIPFVGFALNLENLGLYLIVLVAYCQTKLPRNPNNPIM